MQYLMSNDTVTVFIEGEPHAVTVGAPNYEALRAAVVKGVTTGDWSDVERNLTVAQSVQSWTQDGGVEGFTVANETVMYRGEALPSALNERILKMVAKNEPPKALMNFWTRLKRNPNAHSVQQLFKFLVHTGIPIQEDGTFLAYKGVRKDFRDCHSGSFNNSPGNTIRMDREKVSSDPDRTCHIGLHVGALSYARSFGPQTIIVRVDPENVVCVPNDHNGMKMRVCEYTVMGLFGSKLPDSVFDAETAVPVEASAALDEDDQKATATVAAAPEPDNAVVFPTTGTPWDEFLQMTDIELMAQPMSDLRKFALYNCGITGASKIPGGKEVLIDRILSVTRKPEPVKPEPVKPVKPETQPIPMDAPTMKLPLTGTAWDHLNSMSDVELLEQSMEDLRRYARHNCLIVGASKMAGGKIALVARINEIRRS